MIGRLPIALAAAIFVVLALALAGPAFGRSADVTDASVDLRLAADGSLLVDEHLTFNYDGPFEGSYRDILVRHGERITDVSVSQGGRRYEPGGQTALGSHDRPGVFGVEARPGVYRIVWHYQASDELRRYDISYRVVGGAVAYRDVIDVGWAVWGDQWAFDLDHLSARFVDPALKPADPLYRVWGHPRDVEGETVRGDGAATLEATDVPDHTGVEIRVTVPRTPGQGVAGARAGNGDGLPKILAEEKALDDDYNSFPNRVKRFLANHVWTVLLGLAALSVLVVGLLALLARERPSAAPKYLPEPPDDASPAVAYGIVHEGGDSADTVLATLLDLVDRGYYETSSATTDEEKLDLALKQRPNRPAGELADHERDVLSFFDQLLDGETVAISEMKERIPEHSEVWRGRWERMTEKLDAADEGSVLWDRDLNWARWVLAAVVAVVAAATALCDLSVNDEWVLPAAGGLVLLVAIGLVPATRLRRVDAEHRERNSRWQAFARWTEDFPRLDDDPPATLGLWKRILVYGVAFGTAERMIKSGRIPAPVAEASSSSDGWSAYAFTGGFAYASFSGSQFSSGFASQVAPESSSAGGGGGFSGGGGGFSGGGGGGSW